MGNIKNMILGVLMFVTLFYATTTGFNEWYVRGNSTATLNTATFNVTATNDYLTTWTNQTNTRITESRSIPFIGGSFTLLTGLFQALTLIVDFPNSLLTPVVRGILGILPLPPWFIGFVGIALVIVFAIELINVIKGGSNA